MRQVRLMLQSPLHLLIGMWGSCQVFSSRLLHWPRCSPLNEMWLTAMLMGSTKLKFLFLYCTPRKADFPCHLLCWRTAEMKPQRIARDGGAALLLLSLGHWRTTWSPEASAAAVMLWGQQQKSKPLPCSNPGQLRVTSHAPYRYRSQEAQFSCRAS